MRTTGERIEVRISGTGGQGVITAGIILAEAALRDGKNAVQSQSYGPEARGGASKAEVIIADGDIDYPKVRRPDMFLAMSSQAYTEYIADVAPDGVVVVDPGQVKQAAEELAGRVLYRAPITQLAREVVGKGIVANIVALGVLAGLTGIVSEAALTEAVLARVPRGTEELNGKAVQTGLAYGQALVGGPAVACPVKADGGGRVKA